MEPALMCDALADLADCDLFPDTDPLPPVKTPAKIIDDPNFCKGLLIMMASNAAFEQVPHPAQIPTKESARGFRANARSLGLPKIGGV